MIAIIDYGVGNLRSVEKAFQFVGHDAQVTSDIDKIKSASHIVLPGVGSFIAGMNGLKETGFQELILSQAQTGKPILGICLGMQLLFEKSYEYGEHPCLGLIPGAVRPIAELIPEDLKIPHIGWNALHPERENPLFRYIKEGDFVYFVHSYYAADCGEALIASTHYGAPLTAAVAKDNVYGCQFHPEKSGEVGLKILKAFCELEGTR